MRGSLKGIATYLLGAILGAAGVFFMFNLGSGANAHTMTGFMDITAYLAVELAAGWAFWKLRNRPKKTNRQYVIGYLIASGMLLAGVALTAVVNIQLDSGLKSGEAVLGASGSVMFLGGLAFAGLFNRTKKESEG